MALTNISKDHVNNLLLDLNTPQLNQDKIMKSIQKNSNQYSKLQVLFKQLANIREEINLVIQETLETDNLEKIECRFKKIPGNHYYLYSKLNSNKLFFSMLDPKEWNFEKNNEYVGKYLYDYSLNLQKID